MQKIVAYYRVSTERQGRSGLGLEAQMQAIKIIPDTMVLYSFVEVESGLIPHHSSSKFSVSGLLKGESGTIWTVLEREGLLRTWCGFHHRSHRQRLPYRLLRLLPLRMQTASDVRVQQRMQENCDRATQQRRSAVQRTS